MTHIPLPHRARVRRLDVTAVDGTTRQTWVEVTPALKCFLQVGFQRPQDPQWTPEAGRAPDRQGVLFFDPSDDLKDADRVEMVFGPTGTFVVFGNPDTPWDVAGPSHGEAFVKEVPRQIGLPA